MSIILYPQYYINEVLKNMADIIEDARPGVYDKAEKIRPLIRATGEDIPLGKVMPTMYKAAKTIKKLYFRPPRPGRWTAAEEEQLKSDMYALSLVEVCEKYDRNIRGVLQKVLELKIRVDYPIVHGGIKGYTLTPTILLEACFTKTVYGLGVVLQKNPKAVMGAIGRFVTPAAEEKQETSAPAKPQKVVGRANIEGIPDVLVADFQDWVEKEGVKLYLKNVEETLKQRRRQ